MRGGIRNHPIPFPLSGGSTGWKALNGTLREGLQAPDWLSRRMIWACQFQLCGDLGRHGHRWWLLDFVKLLALLGAGYSQRAFCFSSCWLLVLGWWRFGCLSGLDLGSLGLRRLV